MSTLLECRKLTKRFKTKEVLKQIDFVLRREHRRFQQEIDFLSAGSDVSEYEPESSGCDSFFS